MVPCYFGDSEKPLYGVYHPADAPAVKAAGVVFCNPLGHEYIRSHNAINKLSNLLAKSGYHVFRFDYFGTGDSSGDSEAAGIDQWHEDIGHAIDELKDISGVNKVSLVGLRFGALLAATLPKPAVDRLVLWDPVVSGGAYLEELRAIHQSMLADTDRFNAPGRYSPGCETNEMLGFLYSGGFQQSAGLHDLTNTTWASKRNIALVVSGEHEQYSQLRLRLAQSQCKLDYSVVATDGDWGNPAKIEKILMPYEMFPAIRQRLGSG